MRQRMMSVAYRLVLAAALLLASTSAQTLVPWATFIQNNPKVCPGTAQAPCTIPVNSSVLIAAQDVTVRSLVVYGRLVIRPGAANENMKVNTAFLIASGPNAQINITAADPTDTVTLYLRRNPLAYDDVPNIPQRFMFTGGRVFGGANGARIFVEGAAVKPIYTLLVRHAYSQCGATVCSPPLSTPASIYVADDVTSWPVGSTIVISPSDQQFVVWSSLLAIRPGAYQGKVVKVTKQDIGVWKVDLDRPIPGYNWSATNPPFNTQNLNATYFPRDRYPVYYGDSVLGIQSEVFILDRNIVITGDNFTQRWAPLPPPPWQNPSNGSKINNGWPTPWSPYANSNASVEGLHTLIAGNNCTEKDPCQNGGGWMKMRNVRVEKAGQRGWVGRYPLHFHRMGNCTMCEFSGNVVYNTQQRGITIHSTGNAIVQNNVVYNMKGAGIYVEEGTEVANTIKGNVVVCGSGVVSYSVFNKTSNYWAIADEATDPGVTPGGGSCQQSSTQDFGDPSVILGGCRITGTDNEQADCVQQAGLWALSATNNVIGNRISNNYNCIYYQSTRFADGRLGTDSLGRVCPLHSNWGIVQGNVCHSHQRFYPDVNYPRVLSRSVATNGYVSDLLTQPLCMANLTDDATWCSCRPTLLDGSDNGQALTYVADQLDWGNGFVGQYDLADVQYLRYKGLMNNNAMYWKGTKNMNFKANGGLLHAHVKDSTFFYEQTSTISIAPWAGGTATYFLNTPGISGTILLENITFKGDVVVASWITIPEQIDGAGAALGVNQMCKGYLSGTAEGQICTPQILLKDVDFSQIKDLGNNNQSGTPQSNRPTWIKFGAEAGNPFLGMVVAFDESLCGKKLSPCPFKAVVPKYSTHLLNLPGNPCNATMAPYLAGTPPTMFLPLNSSGDWSRRFSNSIVCSVQTRRLTIWGKAQNTSLHPVDLILVPPGKTVQQGFRMQWMAFNRAYNPSQGTCPWSDPTCCQGTECPASEPRRFAEGYGATIIPQEYFSSPLPWQLVRADGMPIDVKKITMVEFSDVVFDGNGFPGPDTVRISLNGRECVLRSTDERKFMGQYGAMRRIESGGSCIQEWLNTLTAVPPTLKPITAFPTSKPRTGFPTTAFPTPKPRTGFPTTAFPTPKPRTGFPTTSFPTAKPRTGFPTTVFPTSKPRTGVPTTSFPTRKPVTAFPTSAFPTRRPTTRRPSRRPTMKPSRRPTK